MRRFSSVVLVDRRGWLLLQERDDQPAIDPEKWGYPGGHVDPGESYEQAAYRELAEETGVQIDDGLELVGTLTTFHPDTGDDHEVALWAGATEVTDADIVCGEGRQVVFVDPAEAVRLDLTSSAAATLRTFLDSDVYRRLASGAQA